MRTTKILTLGVLAAATVVHAVAPAIPAALVGEWRWTSISGVTYWDSRSSGYMGHGGGMSDTIVFAKDGTFKEYSYIEQSPSAGWTYRTFTTMEGKFDTDGDTIRLTVQKGKYKVEDNRVASRNYDRPMTAEEAKKVSKEYKFALREEGGKRRFVHLFPNEEMKYERIEHAKYERIEHAK